MKISALLLRPFVKILSCIAVSAYLAACSQAPLKAESEKKVTNQSIKKNESALPPQELSEELLYHFLLAEIAMQRGNWNTAAHAYSEIARETRDPRIIQRATEAALLGGLSDLAIENAKLWEQASPASVRAKQTLIILMVNQGLLEESRAYLKNLLKEAGENAGENFMQLGALFAKQTDKASVLKLVGELARAYPDLPEAHFALAQAAFNAGQSDKALQEIKQALKLRPDWEVAALFQAQITQRESSQQAEEYLSGFLKNYPKSKEARLYYARLLAAKKSNYGLAREQFKKLITDFPENAELAFTVGLLSLQLKEMDDAEKYFQRALLLNYKNSDGVRFYLAQVYEGRKNYSAASDMYSAIKKGEFYLSAQIKKAGIMAKQKRLSEARKYLAQITAENNQQRVQILLAEAHLLRDVQEYREAFDLLGKALEKLPNYTDLLYDHAMLAEKVERLDILEQNLRKIIQLKPDHAHAYNALGYTLADHNNRLSEAKNYIEKALKLSPDDPFIMDSMGWVEYRLGNLDQGVTYLRKAFVVQPDPEIAAHLGEVLWAQGKREEALKIWHESLKENPDNQLLKDTLKKFNSK